MKALNMSSKGLCVDMAHFLACIIFSLTLLSTHAKADDLSLLVNGKSEHLEGLPGTTLNEHNWGLGLQYDFEPWQEHWVPSLHIAGFKDSFSNPSYYAGAALSRRFMLSQPQTNIHFDLGLITFLMTRKDYHNNKPFLALAPLMTLGNDKVSINMTYVPKVDPKLLTLFFFQLKFKVFEF